MKKIKTKVLLQSQIENAMRHTLSNKAAAEYLRVSYTLYRKYAKMYKDASGVSLFQKHKNQSGKGVYKFKKTGLGITLDDILLGKHPNYPIRRLQKRLIASKYIVEQCARCGFNEKRPVDLKAPLLINHINGNTSDHQRANLELLCYNCYYITVGNIKKVQFEDDKFVYGEHVGISSISQQDIDDNEISHSIISSVLTDEEKIELLNKINNL